MYVTHAVKHRPHTEHGQPRRASVRESLACRPWVLGELGCVAPAVVVCLGAGAARAVLGPLFRFTERRGEVVPLATGAKGIATRAPTPAAAEELTRHLALARQLAGV